MREDHDSRRGGRDALEIVPDLISVLHREKDLWEFKTRATAHGVAVSGEVDSSLCTLPSAAKERGRS